LRDVREHSPPRKTLVPDSSRLSRAGRLLAEGLVVLFSILAAFLLEGWRADRELAGDLLLELASVQRELETNRDLILAEVEASDRITVGTEALLAELDAAQGRTSVFVPDTVAFLGSMWTTTLDPSLGAIEALIATGRLAQISNPNLRTGLAGLRDRVADAREEQVIVRLLLVEQLLPLIRDVVDISPLTDAGDLLTKASEGDAVTPQERVRLRGLESQTRVSFPNSAAIRNTIRYKATYHVSGRSELASLVVHLDDLIDQVAAAHSGS
jgi:hypothetical protein